MTRNDKTNEALIKQIRAEIADHRAYLRSQLKDLDEKQKAQERKQLGERITELEKELNKLQDQREI